MSTPENRLKRIWDIVLFLHAVPRPPRVRELQSQTGARRATVYRDLEFLREAGIPMISSSLAGVSSRGQAQYGDTTVTLTLRQQHALRVASCGFALLGIHKLSRELDQIIAQCGDTNAH